MESNEHIRQLLEKFKQGILSPSEAKELSSILKERGDHVQREALDRSIQNIWNESPDFSDNAPSARLFANLKSNIYADEAITTAPAQKGITLRSFMRYAAVILMSAGLTWWATTFMGSHGDEMASASYDTEISVAYGSKTKILLPDGSTVNLNSGSTLRYPAKFDSDTRNVYLDGEAYFDVKKDPDHPFLVKTKEITVKVLGTTFNVKSYPDEKTVRASLVTGLIEIYANNTERKTPLVILEPNEQVVFARTEKGLVAMQVDSSKAIVPPVVVNSKTEVAQAVAWKDDRLVFRDEKFVDLVRRMERWYDVEIEIRNEDLGSAKVSGVFEQETIEQALDALKLATPFKYHMEKNRVVITK